MGVEGKGQVREKVKGLKSTRDGRKKNYQGESKREKR